MVAGLECFMIFKKMNRLRFYFMCSGKIVGMIGVVSYQQTVPFCQLEIEDRSSVGTGDGPLGCVFEK